MIKYFSILLVGSLVIGPHAYATEPIKPVDHSGHTMQHDDGHDMVHGDDHMMDAPPSEHSKGHTTPEGHTSHQGDGHHHMDEDHIMDHEGGMIMGQNFDKLPTSCDSISEEIEITVRAGRKYAEKFPGTAFAFDNQEWRVKPCAKVTWHFINEDHVRHQFMMHGLPRYLYKYGMFHLEVTGPKTISGTIIMPGADETYLVHCDIAQHMENGMKAQLVVGKGGENLPSIPGLTPYAFTDIYKHVDLPQVSDKTDEDSIMKQVADLFDSNSLNSGMLIFGLLFGVLSVPLIRKLKPIRKSNNNNQ
ncbi:MAG: cupredoxin domain-containing protein [Nitrosomonas sp.]|nr:cupredoxin domain-containing protein [Nitrosomonas sp.]MDP1950782.1 cupredoxin domain-containing protein [Nitrosomonas sp.]